MTRQYASAGAIVTTIDVASPRLLLLDQTRVTGERQTVAPKGRLEPGEAPLQAAFREVAEEAGLPQSALRYAGYLGQEAYRFTDNDGSPAAKTVDWFLLTTDTTSTHTHAGEGFTTSRWLTTTDAIAAASHPGFAIHLNRAASLLAWRRDGPLPLSTTLDQAIQAVATAARPVLGGYPSAGIAVCGSAARGDYVDGWSDIDLIGYGIPGDSPAAHTLANLVRDVSAQSGVRISLHLTDPDGHRLPTGDPLHDMKLRTALRRLGTDTAVIAGTAPATLPRPAEPTETLGALTALAEFATTRLSAPAATADERHDRTRRTLSVACSAARLVCLTIDPDTDLRLPAVTGLLAHHHPDAPIQRLLLAYDAYRRAGAQSSTDADRLATQVPDALRDLLDRQPAPTM